MKKKKKEMNEFNLNFRQIMNYYYWIKQRAQFLVIFYIENKKSKQNFNSVHLVINLNVLLLLLLLTKKFFLFFYLWYLLLPFFFNYVSLGVRYFFFSLFYKFIWFYLIIVDLNLYYITKNVLTKKKFQKTSCF